MNFGFFRWNRKNKKDKDDKSNKQKDTLDINDPKNTGNILDQDFNENQNKTISIYNGLDSNATHSDLNKSNSKSNTSSEKSNVNEKVKDQEQKVGSLSSSEFVLNSSSSKNMNTGESLFNTANSLSTDGTVLNSGDLHSSYGREGVSNEIKDAVPYDQNEANQTQDDTLMLIPDKWIKPVLGRIAEPLINRLNNNIPLEDLAVTHKQASVALNEISENVKCLEEKIAQCIEETKLIEEDVTELKECGGNIARDAKYVMDNYLGLQDDFINDLEIDKSKTFFISSSLGFLLKIFNPLISLFVLIFNFLLYVYAHVFKGRDENRRKNIHHSIHDYRSAFGD